MEFVTIGLCESLTLARVQGIVPNVTEDENLGLWNDILSPTGYFTSLDAVVDPNDLSFIDETGLMVDYNAFDWSWMPNNRYTWRESIRVRWNPNYYQCYTVQVPDSQSQNVRGVSFVMYLDTFENPIVHKFEASPKKSSSLGIRMVIHGRGTTPDMKTGLSVGPGTETTVSVAPTIRQRLPQPYHGCQSTDQKLSTNASETYNADECIDVCLQKSIIRTCQCVSSQMLFTASQLKSVNYTVCGNQTSPTDGRLPINSTHDLDGYRSAFCLLHIDLDWNSCSERCQWPCVEYAYDTSSSQSSNWPNIGSQMALYESYIYGKTFDDNKFEAYQSIFDAWKNVDVPEDEIANKLSKLDAISRNFLQVNVVLNKNVPILINETVSMPSEVLWSNIGGVLSLWLGVTIMTAVEFVELICVLLRAVYKQRQKVDATSQSE